MTRVEVSKGFWVEEGVGLGNEEYYRQPTEQSPNPTDKEAISKIGWVSMYALGQQERQPWHIERHLSEVETNSWYTDGPCAYFCVL